MIYQRRRSPAQIEAASEQLRRERAAPRLQQEAPGLVSLRLTFDDLRSPNAHGNVTYAKPIMVATAPAYFDIPCSEPRCDGRHDLTQSVLTALRAGLTSFSGRSVCNGWLGDAACDRALTYGYVATFSTK